jgi:hypothetical protein
LVVVLWLCSKRLINGAQGIGGADPSWIPYFLNRTNHQIKDIPLDFVSVHFYASCSNRTDVLNDLDASPSSPFFLATV